MKPTVRLALAGTTAVLAAATVSLAAPAGAAPAGTPAVPSSTVFVQTDHLEGNTVVAYEQSPDGSLRQGETYGTGGLGGQLQGAVVDDLASQGSLLLDREAGLLYAVNAGSDTITVFAVHGDELERVQVLPSGGDFPVSLTSDGERVYVLNALSGGSVQGFVRLGDQLAPVPGQRRALNLDQVPQEGEQEFNLTPGQVLLSPDGDQLLVTTKQASHSILVFGVGPGGALEREPVVNSYPDTSPFAATFDPQGHLAVAMSGTNSLATFALSDDGVLGLVSTVPTGEQGTCWIVGSGQDVYLSNAGTATLSGYTLEHARPTSLGVTPTGDGTVDAAVSPDGRWLHVQTGAEGGLDSFRVEDDGKLTPVGSVVVPDAVGGEGIVVL